MKINRHLLFTLIYVIIPLTIFSQSDKQLNLPGVLELLTKSFEHPSLKKWFSENESNITSTNYYWGSNPNFDRLTNPTKEEDKKTRHSSEMQINQLADRLGNLYFYYYEMDQPNRFSDAAKLDSIRQAIHTFIRSPNGISYQGNFLLTIVSLNIQEEIVFFEMKDSGDHKEFIFDEITLAKQTWLNKWIAENNPSNASRNALSKLAKSNLEQKEPTPLEVSILSLPKDLKAGDVVFSTFDVGYGTFENLQWGGFFMECLERAVLNFYGKEASKLSIAVRKAIKLHKTDIKSLGSKYDDDVPIFTSVLYNPPVNWYERTYYSVSHEKGIEFLLQIQIEFEKGSQTGAIKNIYFSKEDQANYRNYCRYVLLDQEIPMPIAPVSQMKINWEKKKIED